MGKMGTAVSATGAFSLVGGFPAILRNTAQASETKFGGKTIRVLTWSDESGLAAVNNIMRPFEAQTGAKVATDLTGATSEMVAKVKASAAKPQFDLLILSGVGAFELAQAGLLEKPDPSKLPNLSRVFPHLRLAADGYAVGYFLWCDGLLYNAKTFPSPPATYEVLWNKKHAGRVSLPPATWTNAMQLIIIAARLAGGDERNPEAGFKKLADLKGQLLTMGESAAQLAELFRTDALDLGGTYSPMWLSTFLLNPEYNMGATLDLKEGFFYDLQFMVIPKGHPGDTDVIHALVNRALDAKVQGKMAEAVWYGPINQDTVLSEEAKRSPYLPTSEMVKEKGIPIDNEYLATVRQDWIRRYQEIFGF